MRCALKLDAAVGQATSERRLEIFISRTPSSTPIVSGTKGGWAIGPRSEQPHVTFEQRERNDDIEHGDIRRDKQTAGGSEER